MPTYKTLGAAPVDKFLSIAADGEGTLTMLRHKNVLGSDVDVPSALKRLEVRIEGGGVGAGEKVHIKFYGSASVTVTSAGTTDMFQYPGDSALYDDIVVYKVKFHNKCSAAVDIWIRAMSDVDISQSTFA